MENPFDVIISTDRTLMSNHHGKEFLGFMTTGPSVVLPERLWMAIAAPEMKVDKLGRPLEAPYGLRKIEAALIDAGIKAAVIDPDHLKKHLKTAKVLAIGHHDYFALGPPSSEWWALTGKEPLNSKSFRKFIQKPEIKNAKQKGLKIIVGGPAAWQWLWMPEATEKWGIDTIIEGEADKLVVELVENALSGKPLPKYVRIGTEGSPKLGEIPIIKHASVNGLVEIMRGCPRGCRFCSVTIRPMRCYTLDMIEKELRVNSSEGVGRCILHAEDVLLYGANTIKPSPEPLFELHRLVKKYFHDVCWSHVSLSAVKYAEESDSLITRLSELLIQNDHGMIGVEVGVETGSIRLAEKLMPAKASPYPIASWPEVVKDAFAIMHEARIMPAATIVIGFPGESAEDLTKTLELVEDLREFRSLIIPMYFVPLGALKNKDWYKAQPSVEQMELMKACLKHDMIWITRISDWYFKDMNPIIRTLLRSVIFSIRKLAEWYHFLEIGNLHYKKSNTFPLKF
ncbi:MAG: radical SAM protein [Thermoproteota archaeon]